MDNQTNKKMTNSERRDAGMAYISDESVFEEQRVCRKILQRLNFMDRSDFAAISEVVKELFGKSDGAALLDTTQLNLEQSCDRLLSLVKEKIAL